MCNVPGMGAYTEGIVEKKATLNDWRSIRGKRRKRPVASLINCLGGSRSRSVSELLFPALVQGILHPVQWLHRRMSGSSGFESSHLSGERFPHPASRLTAQVPEPMCGGGNRQLFWRSRRMCWAAKAKCHCRCTEQAMVFKRGLFHCEQPPLKDTVPGSLLFCTVTNQMSPVAFL